MNRDYIEHCLELLKYWFGNLLNETNYKSIFLNDIVLSDCKNRIYSVDVYIALLNNYYFKIYLDFVEERFSIEAYNKSDLCYKHITGDLKTLGCTSYIPL